jgi:xylan 1,4-beta-xylosidase
MAIVHNPILSGFNPDPSIVQVNGQYIIATSTFEWFPGIQLHRSFDLVNWELVARPLRRKSQLDLLGVGDSCGVWAPCLSYHEGVYYLIYSNVKNFAGVWKDTPNYLITTEDPFGDWSDPIFIDASGFDGSLFHDDDGRKWYLSLLLDHREGKLFGGIMQQEYDPVNQCLIGRRNLIFSGSEIGITEGPHLYKHNGYYYLMTAEGGTEYGHAVSIARSRNIEGPYLVHPENPIISSREVPSHPIQKAGHGDLFQTPEGDWLAVFLGGRPVAETQYCTLGRETFIKKIEWREGWPYAVNGPLPENTIEISGNAEKGSDTTMHTTRFEEEHWPVEFQTLRDLPSEDWISLRDRKSSLRLTGRESLSSLHRQSLLARRIQHFNVVCTTRLQFAPTHFQHMSGLICYYNTQHWHYLCWTANDLKHTRLEVLSCDQGKVSKRAKTDLGRTASHLSMRVRYDHLRIQFEFATEDGLWSKIGPTLEGHILSDDYVQHASGKYRAAFTGAFIGLCCQDLTGHGLPSYFDYFQYQGM